MLPSVSSIESGANRFLVVYFLVLNATQYSVATSNGPLKIADVLPLNAPLEVLLSWYPR